MSTPIMAAAASALPESSASRPGKGSTPRGRKPQRQRPAAEPSREAKQRVAAILEVLAGGRTPTAAAQALGVSLTRYYLLEQRALHGLLSACEPVTPGRSPDAAREREALQAQCERWQRECARQQALVRAAQRTIGLAPPAPPSSAAKDGKKRRRPRKPVVRALQVVSQLRAETENGAAPEIVSTATAAGG